MSVNGKYRVLQGLYWMLFCAGYGYVTVFLLDRGYEAGGVGVITAVFGALAALAQPLLGRLADRGGRWNWKTLLTALAAAELAVAAGLCLCRGKLAAGLLYGLFLAGMNTMMPLVNGASFSYRRQGLSVDFGTARGLGSLCYAALSLLLGRAVARLGPAAAVQAGALVAALFLGAVLWMPSPAGEPAEPSGAAASGKAGKRRFSLRRYPAFIGILAGIVLLLAFHNITNTYLIQMLENVGGGSANLGTALAIAAVLELPAMFGFSRLEKAVPAVALLLISGVAFALKGVLYLTARSVGMIYAAQLLQAASFALLTPAAVYCADQYMQPADKATGQALAGCAVTVGAVIGNLLGGWVLEGLGLRAMLWFALALTIGGTAAIAAPAAAVLRRRK